MSEPTETNEPQAKAWPPEGIEWLWWGLLVLSCVVGFGMTMFAPV